MSLLIMGTTMTPMQLYAAGSGQKQKDVIDSKQSKKK
jgi:hypothetical protein